MDAHYFQGVYFDSLGPLLLPGLSSTVHAILPSYPIFTIVIGKLKNKEVICQNQTFRKFKSQKSNLGHCPILVNDCFNQYTLLPHKEK